MKIYKIGTTLYLVSKGWIGTKKEGAKVLPAKIIGYQNVNGNILPILKRGKTEIDPTNNQIFESLEEAVDKIKN